MFYVLAFVILFTSRMIINTVKLFINNQPANSQDVSKILIVFGADSSKFKNIFTFEQDLGRLQESESTPQLLTVSKTGMRMQALDAFRG